MTAAIASEAPRRAHLAGASRARARAADARTGGTDAALDRGMEYRSRTLGDLAANHPGATRVFLRNRLDFCCGGKRTLEAACVQAGLDPYAIGRELDDIDVAVEERPWETRSLAELVDHIESHHHMGLRRDLPPLIAAARKVERVHADKPGVPAGLADVLVVFWEEMQSHMAKEERVLFPAVRRGARGEAVAMPIGVMEREHDQHADALRRIRRLTGDLEAPPHACATWRALYDGLAHVERELHEHIHLENNVLFQRARGAA
jgi:regulator of cell morphogenesis and NO signaling